MQNAIELLSCDYYLNYPLINALRHGALLIAADDNGIAVWKPRENFFVKAK